MVVITIKKDFLKITIKNVVSPIQYDDEGKSIVEVACSGNSALAVRFKKKKKQNY